MKLLIIDNYDSFTYNLVQLVYRVTQQEPLVIRNDELDYAGILQLPIDGIIISAGPGRPEKHSDLGIAGEIILKADKPVLGICLGMQAIVHYYGGSILFAPEQMHGRSSEINHDNQNLFFNIPQRFTAMRYHSLIADAALPADIKKTAWTNDNIVMAIQHKSKPLWGVQFHPESISTDYGDKLIKNFLNCISPNKIGITQNILPKVAKPNRSGSSLCITQYQHWIDPASVFENLYSKADDCYWLDSNNSEHDLSNISYMGDSSSRYSYIVKYYHHSHKLLIDNTAIESQHILDFLEQKLNLHHNNSNPDHPFSFSGGFVGWLGYECDPHAKMHRLTSTSKHVSDYPDAAFIFSDRFLIFDHRAKLIFLAIIPTEDESEITAWLNNTASSLNDIYAELDLPKKNMSSITTSVDQHALTFKLAKSRENYIDDILTAKEKIRQGESYELCLTNSLSTQITCSGFDIYKILRTNNPAPFSSYIKISGIEVVSSSPERFLSINEQRILSSKPIKGTAARVNDHKKDAHNKHFLQTNIKDRAENLMIVDLLRNDLSQVCKNGSVNVSKLLDIESFTTVHQLVSTIEGVLKNDQTSIDCIKACFPGGSMTGAPKIRSMEILADIETQARGIYSGTLGYFSLNGCCDLSIVIRTIIVHKSKASIGCGGAIVALSDAEQEFAEILLKAKSLIESIVIAEKGEFKPQYFNIAE